MLKGYPLKNIQGLVRIGLGMLIMSFFSLIQLPIYAEEREVGQMSENLHWLGHDSFRLDASKIIYFDPWKLSQGSKKADIILITHEHFDHYSLEDIKLICSKDTVIVGPEEVTRSLSVSKSICKEIKTLSPGENIEVAGVTISAVPSYNTNKQFHPESAGNLGFIVLVDGAKIYHAGDTDFIPQMKGLSCDIALLPVSGTYVMTAEEAVEAALAIKPRIAIPMHYGDIVGSASDAKKFQDLLKDKIEVHILAKGG
ncbi:MAG: MBL fold metallo-hydrolase [Candidatus Omnitrophota bacterium]